MAVAKNTEHILKSPGPTYFPRNMFTTSGPDSVRVTSVTDTTLSIVQVTLDGQVIGMGVAKRHPDDTRNTELGIALAAARAFMDTSIRYAASVDLMLNPPEDPSLVARKALRRLSREETNLRKAARRAAARERHRLRYGWDHTNHPYAD